MDHPVDARILLNDDYSDNRVRGGVVGSVAPDGSARGGADAERCISVDGGAARFRPMIRPGWGRCGLSYGPLDRAPGRALAVFLINGHNLSQTYELRDVHRRFARWAVGSGADPLAWRALTYLLRARQREGIVRKLRRWYVSRERTPRPAQITESLAVGFFPDPAPGDPLTGAHAFVVHGTKDYDNGELWATTRSSHLSAFKSFQNVQTLYVVVLRDRGAAMYAAALPGAHGLGGFPMMRPLAIDPGSPDQHDSLYPGVHQSVLGEIGFTNDTRIYSVRAADVAELAPWYGTAHAADTLTGDGALDQSEVGGRWHVSGAIEKLADGAHGEGHALTDPGARTGLVHALVDLPDDEAEASLVWRARDAEHCWRLVVSGSGARVERVADGEAMGNGKWAMGEELIGSWASPERERGDSAPAPISLQVLDDGVEISAFVNGTLIGERIRSDEPADATGVGFSLTGSARVRDFEAHPREVPIPEELRVGEPWSESGSRIVVRDDFAGGAGELDGRTTPEGGAAWRRLLGTGVFELTGDTSLRVRATKESPCPGRTIYGFDWPDPGLADLEVEVTPPGSARGQGERGRGGFVFGQDDGNALLINLWLDDYLETASISTFFRYRGWEDIYDAVWTCLGPSRATWGVPFRLRAVFDGMRYRVHVNGEPVLHRSLDDVYPGIERFRINRVALMANWEWGNDTGTVFRDFVARGKGR